MTLINQDTGKAVRASVKGDFTGRDMEETKRIIADIPDAQLITLQDVQVEIPKFDLPGFPQKTAVCSVCGEKIMDGRDIERDGAVLCRGCANGMYYQVITK
jgi:formylmethanofuran dehydrogenase subunit E